MSKPKNTLTEYDGVNHSDALSRNFPEEAYDEQTEKPPPAQFHDCHG